MGAEHTIETKRNAIETLKLQWQEVKGREESLLEQFAETEFSLDELSKTIASDAQLRSIKNK